MQAAVFGNVCMTFFVYTSMFIAMGSSLAVVKYGEFDLHIEKFTSCKGPKRKDCALITSKILNDTTVLLDVDVNQNIKPTKVKITAMSNGKLLLRLQADDPCNHLFLRPLLQTMLNITDRCVVLKGHYVIPVDLQEIASKYYGGNFVYGNLTFKSMFYNNDCNLSCAVVTVSFQPKDKEGVMTNNVKSPINI